MKTKAPSMADLMSAWQEAKAEESAANAKRLEIEKLMVAQIPAPEGDEGTVSMVVGDFKLGVRYGVTRSVDSEKLQSMWETLPAKAQEAFTWKASVSTPKLRALAEWAPADYQKLVACVEVRPSKPSVSVEQIEREVA